MHAKMFAWMQTHNIGGSLHSFDALDNFPG